MGFIRILIMLVVLVSFPVIVIFVFTKVKSQDTVQITPQITTSPESLNSPAPGATNLKECDQDAGAQENCYWGSDEFSSPSYPSQQQGVQ